DLPRKVDVGRQMLGRIVPARFNLSVLDDNGIGGQQRQRGRAVARGERGVEADHSLLGIVSEINGARRRRKGEEGDQQHSAADGAAAQSLVSLEVKTLQNDARTPTVLAGGGRRHFWEDRRRSIAAWNAGYG